MKKTSKDLMEWLGLKVGDRIEVKQGTLKATFEVRKDFTLLRFDNNICYNLWDILNLDYKMLPQPKRVGDLKCNTEIEKCKLKGKNCPLTPICVFIGETPYDRLKIWKESDYFDQEIYDIIKSRLDKKVDTNDSKRAN